MRLTADLVNSSLSYLNPLKERELLLRGHKIPAIENLGVAKDYDAIDLTDNDVPHLSNFPLLPRLHTLLLARNRVVAFAPTLGRSLPALTTLVLEGNRISELADVDPLAGCMRLTHLVLMGCPVCARDNYRSWLIWRCPSVRFLDYKKVKEVERDRAKKLFGTAEEPTALAAKISNIKSTSATQTFDPSTTSANSTGKISRIALTDAEKKKLKEMIRNAKTLQEIERLEKELNEGKVPGGVVDRALQAV
ncbi:MAG: U2 snRNP complex subunit [Chrysothrix sp. TS-e1954]|nr:MAG: U2 snRNP complex subunit [Chrysothrix sp. TS-e1954]